MKLLLLILLYFYASVGMIIGLKLMNVFKKWYEKLGFIVFKMLFWFPNIFADIIVSNMKRGE